MMFSVAFKSVQKRGAPATALTGAMLAVAACMTAGAAPGMSPGTSPAAADAPPLLADTIWIQKGERKLHLISNNKVLRTFPISLGQNPRGHKQREGDSRTPEGLYTIASRRHTSDYYRALEISYPGEIDLQLAAARGVPPGGQIMIHGQPNDPLKKVALKKDWTQGCIALADRHMHVVWKATPPGTRVVIEP